jgi:hypothetical protein
MKKPLKETLVFKIAKSLAAKVPVVGDVIENIESKDGGKGTIDLAKLTNQIIRLVTFAIVVREFVIGNIDLTYLLGF